MTDGEPPDDDRLLDLVRDRAPVRTRPLTLKADEAELGAELALPDEPTGVAVVALASGSDRHSPHNGFLAERLQESGLAVLLLDLLTAAEIAARSTDGGNRFEITGLAGRIVAAVDQLDAELPAAGLPIGVYGEGEAGTAALLAGAERPNTVAAVVAVDPDPELLPIEACPALAAPALVVTGNADPAAIRLHEAAIEAAGSADSTVEMIAGGDPHLVAAGALDVVAELSGSWFRRHLASGMPAAVESGGG